MRLPRLSAIGLTAFLTFVSMPLSIGDVARSASPQLLAQTSDARKAEADRLLQQGIEQFQTSQFEAALQSWRMALEIYQEIQDRQSEGGALGNLGAAYVYLGDYPKAIDYSQQYLAIAREIQDRQSEGKALGNLGAAYFYLGDYAKAIDYSQQQLAIAREIQDRYSEGAALGNLGLAYSSLGDYTKAIDYLQQQLTIVREIQNRQGEVTALSNLGIVYGSLGDYTKAIDYLQQQLAIAREIQDRYNEGSALGNLGFAYLELEDYTKAIDYSQQQLAIAREIQDRYSEGNALGKLGAVYLDLGDYTKAVEYNQQSLAIAREIKDLNGEGDALHNLGLAFYRQGNLALAQTNLMKAIKVSESLRRGLEDRNKVSIFETQRSSYGILQKVLIAQNQTDRALEIAERGRGRAFVELLQERLSSGVQQQISLVPPTIAELKQIARLQNAILVQYSVIYDNFQVEGKQQYKESEIYIWVINPTGKVTFRTTDLKPLLQKQNITLENLVTSSRDSIGARGRGIEVTLAPNANQTQQLKQLHQLLIEPIADILPTNPNERVLFIPQRSLFFVPFAALQDKNGKYLIEKHTILTAPSIQVLSFTRQQKQRVTQAGKQNILVVGNPAMPSISTKVGSPPEKLADLPGAEQEAIEIARLLNTKAIKGNEATETAIVSQLPNAKIIHLATHGLLDDFTGAGVPGAIALAPSNKDDGLLTANEIFELNLNADLVVLSACDTGRGFVTGDGVIGLSRSLISAGTPSVIVSLWAVPDAPTAELMGEFYRQWQSGKMDKAAALRQAMLTTMKQHPNPRDWAAFTLIGEAN